MEMRPDANSKRQRWVAEDVADSIHSYEEASRHLQERLIEVRAEVKKSGDPSNWTGTVDFEDADLLKATQFVVTMIHAPELGDLMTKCYEAALKLIDHITTATALGVIRPSDGLSQKLKECEEDKRRLSRQILEYKKDLKLV